MLRLHGPKYRWQGEITNEQVIYVDDHHYDEDTKTFPVQHLIDASPQKPLLVMDNLCHNDSLADYEHISLPMHLVAEVEQFRQHRIEPNWQNKTRCFNFMVNKPRPNRLQLLEWIHLNGFTSFTHSLPWQVSQWSSISITDYFLPGEVKLNRGVRNGSWPNAEIYQKLLQRKVFEPSCVSAITEPCYVERESIISEKTIMAIWGGTIPVWIGGWRLPDVMREHGFDVFDDVVDHSYSVLDDPAQRCQQAMQRNRHLFENFDTMHHVVKSNHHRLQHNLNLMKSNPFFTYVAYCLDQDARLRQIAKWWGLDQLAG